MKWVWGGLFFLAGCAVISTPSGGPRDEEPPVLQAARIDTARRTITLRFNEWVDIVPRGTFFINPGGIAVSGQARGKKVVIRYPDSLRRNEGYILDATETIKDITEGNKLPALSLWLPIDSTARPDSLTLTVRTRQYGTDRGMATEIILRTPKGIFRTQTNQEGNARINFLPPGKYEALAFEDKNRNQQPDPGEWTYYTTFTMVAGSPPEKTFYPAQWPHHAIRSITPIHPALWEIQFDAAPRNVTVTTRALSAGQWRYTLHEKRLRLWIDTVAVLPVRFQIRWQEGDTIISLRQRAAQHPVQAIEKYTYDPLSGRFRAHLWYPARTPIVETPYYAGDIRCDSLARMADTLPVVRWKADVDVISTDSVGAGLRCWHFSRNRFLWAGERVRSCDCTRPPLPPARVMFLLDSATAKWHRPYLEIFGKTFHVEPVLMTNGKAVLFLPPDDYMAFIFDDSDGNGQYSSGDPTQKGPADPLIRQPRKFRISEKIREAVIRF